MNESQKINEDVRAAAFTHVKPFFDDLNIIAARVEQEIAEMSQEEKDQINNT